MIENGYRVSFEYTVFLEDGTEVDSNIGEDPMVFVVGTGQIFPALEQELLGLKVGEQKHVLLAAKDAYGPVLPEAFREVDLETVPTSFRYVGAVLGVQDPAGGVYPIRVHKIDQNKVTLDFNHPLAGKSLAFDVRILSVQED